VHVRHARRYVGGQLQQVALQERGQGRGEGGKGEGAPCQATYHTSEVKRHATQV
jgi:hypothetical protein